LGDGSNHSKLVDSSSDKNVELFHLLEYNNESLQWPADQRIERLGVGGAGGRRCGHDTTIPKFGGDYLYDRFALVRDVIFT
jgi:hypothetical protein